MRQVLLNLRDSDDRLGEYAYERYNIRRMLNSDGGVKNERTYLARRAFIDGDGFTQQIQRNGAAVSPEELKRERDAFLARQQELRAMTPAERKKIEEEELSKRREETSWLKEFPDALRYRKVGEQVIDGRTALVLECEPRPGYKATSLRARVFEKVRGKVWIDKEDLQIVKIEARVFDDVNVGWGVAAKVHEGTEFQAERRKHSDGEWLPVSQRVKFSARVLLVKTLAQEETTRYSQFRHKSVALASGTAQEEEARSRGAAAR